MARTSSDIVIDAEPSAIMAVIADFDSYPVWATGVEQTDVLGQNADGRASQVHFVLNSAPIRDEYVLDYTWQADRSVSWSLAAPGSILTAMDGAYSLDRVASGGTCVTYNLSVSVSIPLLGMLKRKAEKIIIDTALQGLKDRIEGDESG